MLQQIGPKGAKAIAEGAADNPRLEVLDLSHNALGDLGGCYIGELIKRNERLQHFDLTGVHSNVTGNSQTNARCATLL